MRLIFKLLVLLPFTGAGQSLTGKVVEKSSGEALPFANVLIKGTGIGVTTNSDGFFNLPNIPSFGDSIVISYVGYQTSTFPVSPKGKQQLTIFPLEPITSELNEVVISAETYKMLNTTSGISTATLSTAQLANLPSIGETDIFRSLQLLPGVSGTNESSSGLYIRGSTPDKNLVLLDGMTVYKVDHFFGFFSAFNTNAIKDVQLHKGAFPAKYGGRTSGVIDLTGKTGSFEKLKGSVDLNLLSINASAEVPISNKLSLLVAGRRSYTDVMESGLFNKIKNTVIGTDNLQQLVNSNVNTVEPTFYFYDWNSKLSYRPSQKDLVTLSVYNGKDYLDESRSVERLITSSGANPANRLFVADLSEKTGWGNTGFSGKWSRQWGPKLYTNTLVAASEYFSNYNRNSLVTASLPDQDSVTSSVEQRQSEVNGVHEYSARVNLEWQVSDEHNIEGGAAFSRTKVHYQNTREDSTILGSDQTGDNLALYISDTWSPLPGTSLRAGLRWTNYNLAHKNFLEPRVQFTYEVEAHTKLKFAYGRHYQWANRIINENITQGARDFWLLADNDLVDVSSSDQYIVGITREVGQWVFDIEGYYKTMTGLSEFSMRFRRDNTFDKNELFFTGAGVAKGIEFLIQKKQGDYTGWVTYTLGKVRNTFPGLNNGEEFPALQDQLHEFKMVHCYAIGKWNLSATFIFGSGKPFTEPEGQYSIRLLDGRTFSYIGVGAKNGSRLPPYHRMDVSANYGFQLGKAKAVLGLSIFNLYNHTNIWYKQYDFGQDPVLITNVTYMGLTPNISFGLDF